jgi:NAD(P)-dependent dehydrogenase (short-subunit alcohol dehydrogenase family)
LGSHWWGARNSAGQQAFLLAARTTRLGDPGDLAAVVTFLLSDEAEWINGQVWFIGGASHLRQ